MPGTPMPRFGLRTLLVGGLLVVSASCAGTAVTTHPGPPSTSSTSAAPLPVDPVCSHTPPTITARTGDRLRPVCLRVGQSLTITTQASPTQPWQSMTVSDTTVLVCTSHPANQGALTAVCKALRPGAVTASTTTAPFAGDPHGPPQYIWTLTVHVEPAS